MNFSPLAQGLRILLTGNVTLQNFQDLAIERHTYKETVKCKIPEQEMKYSSIRLKLPTPGVEYGRSLFVQSREA